MAKITHQREQTETIDMEAFGVGTETPSQLDRTRRRSLPLAARIVLGRLARIRRGHLIVRLPDGSHHTFAGSDGGAAEVVELEIHRWRFFSRLLRRADIGAGESFVDGDWSTSHLVGLTRLFLDNESEIAPSRSPALTELPAGTVALKIPLIGALTQRLERS